MPPPPTADTVIRAAHFLLALAVILAIWGPLMAATTPQSEARGYTMFATGLVGAVINVVVIRRATKRLREAQDRDRERRLMARRDVDTDLSTWDSLRDQFRSTDHTSTSTAFYRML